MRHGGQLNVFSFIGRPRAGERHGALQTMAITVKPNSQKSIQPFSIFMSVIWVLFVVFSLVFSSFFILRLDLLARSVVVSGQDYLDVVFILMEGHNNLVILS